MTHAGSITRKLREAPFPLQSFAPQVVWNLAGRWEEEKEKKRRREEKQPLEVVNEEMCCVERKYKKNVDTFAPKI